MVKFQFILFTDQGDFKYRLKEEVTFKVNKKLGNWNLISPQTNEIVASCIENTVTVYEGYMWDGSTVVGDYYEDEATLEASLLHDVLYNAYKNPQDIKVSFNLFQADQIMMQHLLSLYKDKGFVKRWLFPHLYFWGLTTIGIPWKFGNNDYYTLQKKEE